MKIGSTCYATSRGLGHLARDFFNHGLVTHPYVVCHSRVPENTDWYPGAPRTRDINGDKEKICQYFKGMDALLFFETPFNWSLMDWAAEQGIRTYLITMYECTPISHRKPYRYICPSALDMEYFPTDSVYLPLPVEYPWRRRCHAEHFVHNGGYLGLRGREGTTLLIEAMEYVKSPIKLTIRVQENVGDIHRRKIGNDKRITYIAETVPYETLYATGDVVVQPQKFNGCSLPLQEALASGMVVMSTDRFPMNTWLPKEPLIPVAAYGKARIGGAYMEFDEAHIKPEDIATTIDAWHGKDITALSEYGRQWAKQMTWEVLGPKYREVLSN